jgi:hypothetical protein
MRRMLRRALLALALLGSKSAAAQQGHLVLVAPAVRAQLARAWDDTSPDQHERAYCMVLEPMPTVEFPKRYMVMSLLTAHVTKSSGYSVEPHCPDLANIAVLHTHNPVTCQRVNQALYYSADCAMGGNDAWQCMPSPQDNRFLRRFSQMPFHGVQCDRNAINFYWQDELPPPGAELPPPPSSVRPALIGGLLASAVIVLLSKRH